MKPIPLPLLFFFIYKKTTNYCFLKLKQLVGHKTLSDLCLASHLFLKKKRLPAQTKSFSQVNDYVDNGPEDFGSLIMIIQAQYPLRQTSPGILVIAGDSTTHSSTEFWSPAAGGREEGTGSCVLDDYPRDLQNGPTVNFVAGQLVTCLRDRCDIYQNKTWSKLTDTRSTRWFHSSAQTEDRILLIGGHGTTSTEWIPLDGGPSQPGPFRVRHGSSHCTIQSQVFTNTIVVTGGSDTLSYVTQYQLTGDSNEIVMTQLTTQRSNHACGVYRTCTGQQVQIDSGLLLLLDTY